MSQQARSDEYSVSLAFGRNLATVGEMSELLMSLDRLHHSLARTAAFRFGHEDPGNIPSLPLDSIVKRSPLIVDLATAAMGGGVGLAALRMVGAAIREPERIGEFFPRIGSGRFDGRRSLLEARQNLQTLKGLGGEVHVSTSGRDSVQDEDAIRELRGGVDTSQSAGGGKKLSTILDQLDQSIKEMITNKLERREPRPAQQDNRQKFTFADLEALEGAAIQLILRKVDSRDLALALKGAPFRIREKVLGNLSPRAREDTWEAIDLLGRSSTAAIETARTRIAGEAQKLVDSGQIELGPEWP